MVICDQEKFRHFFSDKLYIDLLVLTVVVDRISGGDFAYFASVTCRLLAIKAQVDLSKVVNSLVWGHVHVQGL